MSVTGVLIVVRIGISSLVFSEEVRGELHCFSGDRISLRTDFQIAFSDGDPQHFYGEVDVTYQPRLRSLRDGVCVLRSISKLIDRSLRVL